MASALECAPAAAFQCASPTNNIHLPIVGKSLQCGHALCYSCFTNIMQAKKFYRNVKQFGCKHCGKIYDNVDKPVVPKNVPNKKKNKNSKPIVEPAVQIPPMNLICEAILNEYRKSLTRARANDNGLEEHVERIFDEIDIKIESLKCELDNIRDEFRNQLNSKKDDFTRNVTEKVEKVEKDIRELENGILKKTKFSPETLMKYEDNIKALNEVVDSMPSEISLQISDSSLSASIIGTCSVDNTLVKRFETKNFKSFEMNPDTRRAQVLPNHNLLVYSQHQMVQAAKLELYDGKTFEKLKTVTDLRRITDFNLTSITTNGKDKIYLCDGSTPVNSRIFMTDLDLNVIKVYSHPKTQPMDADFFKGHLYICNPSGGSIVKLTENLKFVKYFKLDANLQPYRIKFIGHVACVLAESCVLFYDMTNHINSIKLMYKYEFGVQFSYINVLNNHFYLSSNKFTMKREDDQVEYGEQMFYCFTATGDSYEITELTRLHPDMDLKVFADLNGSLVTTFVNDNNFGSEDFRGAKPSDSSDDEDDDDDDDDDDDGNAAYNLYQLLMGGEYDSDDEKYGPFGYMHSAEAFTDYHSGGPRHRFY